MLAIPFRTHYNTYLTSAHTILPFDVAEDEGPPVISSIAFDMASCDAIYLFILPPTFNKGF